jgi:hypothetical protein
MTAHSRTRRQTHAHECTRLHTTADARAREHALAHDGRRTRTRARARTRVDALAHDCTRTHTRGRAKKPRSMIRKARCRARSERRPSLVVRNAAGHVRVAPCPRAPRRATCSQKALPEVRRRCKSGLRDNLTASARPKRSSNLPRPPCLRQTWVSTRGCPCGMPNDNHRLIGTSPS